jgi:glycerol-3-phosphate dehydrogenase
MLTRSPLPSSFQSPLYDIIIIGAGVVGSALARELSLLQHKICIIDQANDVGDGGASKANSAIAHTGFDAEPGSLEAKLVCQASRKWPEMASLLKIPYCKVGALMVATEHDQMKYLHKYYENAKFNQVEDVELISGARARKIEPKVAEGNMLLGGLFIKNEAIVDPFALCSSLAEIAYSTKNCDFLFQHQVIGINKKSSTDDTCQVTIKHTSAENTENHNISGKRIINCAGLGSRQIADMYQGLPFDVNPRRGQFLLYDRNLRSSINHILLPVPGPLGKGILVTPTIFGNVLIGPDAEDLTMNNLSEATQTTLKGLRYVQDNATRLLPELKNWKPIAQYAGARANCKQGSYLLRYNDGNIPNIVTVAGIRSTGISSSFELAREIRLGMEKEMGLTKNKAVTVGMNNNGRDRYPAWYEARNGVVVDDIVCYCEQISYSHITKELSSGPWNSLMDNTDSLKRRTRVTQGRCQGFNCLPKVCQIIANEKQISLNQVTKHGKGTEWFPFSQATLGVSKLNQTTISSTPNNNKQPWDIVIIGGGPSGCGILRGLIDQGYFKSSTDGKKQVLLLERSSELGGIPSRYSRDGPKTFIGPNLMSIVTGHELAEYLKQDVHDIIQENKQQCHVEMNTLVTKIEPCKEKNAYQIKTSNNKYPCIETKHIILATGARESTPTEKQLITGHRTHKLIYTNHLLDIVADEYCNNFYYLGAGLVARGSASHYHHGTTTKMECIAMPRDEDRELAKWYFDSSVIGNRPIPKEIRIHKSDYFDLKNDDYMNERINTSTSKLICSGELVPNDELWKQFVTKQNSGNNNNNPNKIYRVGNVAPHVWTNHKIWPAMMCYLNARLKVAWGLIDI